MHEMIRAPVDFPVRDSYTLKKAELPSLSDYVYPVLMDVDPEQLVEDEFKHRHSQIFCWRMLKLISQVDLTTFSATPKPSATTAAAASQVTAAGAEAGSVGQRGPFEVFEGNIEEQARILCKQFMKREILDYVPEEDHEQAEEEEEHDLGEDVDDDVVAEVVDHEMHDESKDKKTNGVKPIENGHGHTAVKGRESVENGGVAVNGTKSNGMKQHLEIEKASETKTR